MGRNEKKGDTMAVLAKDRTISKLEFYKNACKLRRQLIFLMGRDFGVKPRIREPRFYTKKWDVQDAVTFSELLEKYGEARVIDDYPKWMTEHVRDGILFHLSRMMTHITQAYTIWATTKAEADLRRNAQDLAIADCENLKQELELVADILPVKVEKLLPYVEAIDREIALLKGWRKADNKRRAKLD